jgi:hypothetical protein
MLTPQAFGRAHCGCYRYGKRSRRLGHFRSGKLWHSCVPSGGVPLAPLSAKSTFAAPLQTKAETLRTKDSGAHQQPETPRLEERADRNSNIVLKDRSLYCL